MLEHQIAIFITIKLATAEFEQTTTVQFALLSSKTANKFHPHAFSYNIHLRGE
jgi:hypothetical protein